MNDQVKEVPITEDTVLSGVAKRKLGTSTLVFPEGEAVCRDSESLTIITAEDSDGEQFLIVVAVLEVSGMRIGSLSPLDPAEARLFAESLNHAADLAERSNGTLN